MRARTHIESMSNGKQRIIVDEIPYQVNKAAMVSRIADLAHDKVIEGITDLRDESNMDGVRVVMELRKDVQPEVLLNQLYRLTPLQATFAVNNVVLVNGAPKQCSLKDILTEYIRFPEGSHPQTYGLSQEGTGPCPYSGRSAYCGRQSGCDHSYDP